ncbi:MAG: NrfD/PsrC family molybdoenzyme membrane anchor subunit, partial [Pyrinomonadaceae bacterium]
MAAEIKKLELPPIVEGEHSYAEISRRISNITLARKTHFLWFLGFGVTFLLTMMLFYAIAKLLVDGIGIWGVNIPVGWGFAIGNFVWWIGIGHAGTLISAILLLMNQKWRTSINRFAEAMTLFAVAAAGLFPLLHLGRPYYFYWLLPYPNTMALFPQFRSPLVWDVFAVFTYLTVSLIFWYIGMIPDLATLRDRAKSRFTFTIFGIMSLGWRGSAEHWPHYEKLYLLLAGLATP